MKIIAIILFFLFPFSLVNSSFYCVDLSCDENNCVCSDSDDCESCVELPTVNHEIFKCNGNDSGIFYFSSETTDYIAILTQEPEKIIQKWKKDFTENQIFLSIKSTILIL